MDLSWARPLAIKGSDGIQKEKPGPCEQTLKIGKVQGTPHFFYKKRPWREVLESIGLNKEGVLLSLRLRLQGPKGTMG